MGDGRNASEGEVGVTIQDCADMDRGTRSVRRRFPRRSTYLQ